MSADLDYENGYRTIFRSISQVFYIKSDKSQPTPTPLPMATTPPATVALTKTTSSSTLSSSTSTSSSLSSIPTSTATPTNVVPAIQLRNTPPPTQRQKPKSFMIVSETEILRSQQVKEDSEVQQTQQLNILQRFKSASIGNLIDLPNEDDKKSIADRVRGKLRGGVFKINIRSPKSEKKTRGGGLFKRAEATSLYLEDGLKPKYQIFGAPLEELELNCTTQPNVPRFVVDAIEYIERDDCIQQDGLYRASGNKISIDELKQKLSESYIYDSRLLNNIDDIHTLTSLLKQFFRELGAPLIPQSTYERLGRNLNDAAAIETMRQSFNEMREPNRSTLRFLIKHLTNVASVSHTNRMPASNLAIVWGPCLLSANQIDFDFGRMNTLAKVLIENYERIFITENERLVS